MQYEIKEITGLDESSMVNLRCGRDAIIRRFSNANPELLTESEKDGVFQQIRDFNYGA